MARDIDIIGREGRQTTTEMVARTLEYCPSPV